MALHEWAAEDNEGFGRPDSVYDMGSPLGGSCSPRMWGERGGSGAFQPNSPPPGLALVGNVDTNEPHRPLGDGGSPLQLPHLAPGDLHHQFKSQDSPFALQNDSSGQGSRGPNSTPQPPGAAAHLPAEPASSATSLCAAARVQRPNDTQHFATRCSNSTLDGKADTRAQTAQFRIPSAHSAPGHLGHSRPPAAGGEATTPLLAPLSPSAVSMSGSTPPQHGASAPSTGPSTAPATPSFAHPLSALFPHGIPQPLINQLSSGAFNPHSPWSPADQAMAQAAARFSMLQRAQSVDPNLLHLAAQSPHLWGGFPYAQPQPPPSSAQQGPAPNLDGASASVRRSLRQSHPQQRDPSQAQQPVQPLQPFQQRQQQQQQAALGDVGTGAASGGPPSHRHAPSRTHSPMPRGTDPAAVSLLPLPSSQTDQSPRVYVSLPHLLVVQRGRSHRGLGVCFSAFDDESGQTLTEPRVHFVPSLPSFLQTGKLMARLTRHGDAAQRVSHGEWELELQPYDAPDPHGSRPGGSPHERVFNMVGNGLSSFVHLIEEAWKSRTDRQKRKIECLRCSLSIEHHSRPGEMSVLHSFDIDFISHGEAKARRQADQLLAASRHPQTAATMLQYLFSQRWLNQKQMQDLHESFVEQDRPKGGSPPSRSGSANAHLGNADAQIRIHSSSPGSSSSSSPLRIRSPSPV